jgi:phage terminase small subunit
MPALTNPKQERFAQEYAKGKTQSEAYKLAGYAPSEPGASRLASNVKVRARISEIQEKAAAKVGLTIASATEHLLRLAEKGEQIGDASGFQASRASIMDACKLNGLVVDKSQIDGALAFTGIARRIVGA